MTPEQLRERIARWDRWHYAIELPGGVRTPIFDPEHAVRHEQRRRHFFEPLVQWLGGLQGRRVLDLGCNAGFWSLAALRAGADHVRGIDGRQMHVEQAQLVREALGFDAERWAIGVGDVLGTDLGTGWDVVLCLGLLYHLDRPRELIERIARTGAPVVVIDTEVHPASGRRGAWGRETRSDPRSATASDRVQVLTAEAIDDALRGLGYDVALLRPRFDDWTGSADYRGGWRRTLVASRGPDLGELMAEREPVRGPLRQRVRWLRWLWWRARGRRL